MGQIQIVNKPTSNKPSLCKVKRDYLFNKFRIGEPVSDKEIKLDLLRLICNE